MRSQSRSTRMWGVTVAGLCVLWFAHPAGAIPLESWDDIVPANKRFKVLSEFNGEAVLDKETGLVWEQAPENIDPNVTTLIWENTRRYCVNKNVGGTRGWRLPSVVELASLIDPSLPAPFVPANAFTIGGTPGVQSAKYWSATTFADIPSTAWFVDFGTGFVANQIKASPPLAWCVRGGMNADAY